MPGDLTSKQKGPERIWFCKVGGPTDFFQRAADIPMRNAIAKAFRDVTGLDPEFIFSGWGGELTEGERAVVENRAPSLCEINQPHQYECKRCGIAPTEGASEPPAGAMDLLRNVIEEGGGAEEWPEIAAYLARPAVEPPAASVIPREPSHEMMQAGLYHSSHDSEYADVHSIWVNMWDKAAGASEPPSDPREERLREAFLKCRQMLATHTGTFYNAAHFGLSQEDIGVERATVTKNVLHCPHDKDPDDCMHCADRQPDEKVERCQQCEKPLPPLAQWSMPSCPECVDKADRQADETTACQHDLLAPNPTVTVDPTDPFAAHCDACGYKWRTRPVDTSALRTQECIVKRCPQYPECRCGTDPL